MIRKKTSSELIRQLAEARAEADHLLDEIEDPGKWLQEYKEVAAAEQRAITAICNLIHIEQAAQN